MLRPHGIGDGERLLLAGSRARELRDSWQTANFSRPMIDRAAAGERRGLAKAGRAAAGRLLIGMGQRVLPSGAEPCV
jgi:hypothetical protein